MSVDPDRVRGEEDRAREIRRWVAQLREEAPIEEVIDRVQSRLQNASVQYQASLAFGLQLLFAETGRYDEALRLVDGVIDQRPDNVSFPIAKSTLYFLYLDEPEKALEVIDFALERAFRTLFFRRQALGMKARILLKLRRGKELGQVVEQIMALEMFPEVSDIRKERDFVDAAPPGLLPDDIVARYDEFCPKMDEDSQQGAIVMSEDRDSMPLYELDAMIISVFQKAYWRKTASVITRVMEQCQSRRLPVSDTEIFDRLLHLVDSGVLESAGDLARWRHSEVRPVRNQEGGEERGQIRELDRWIGQLRLGLARKEISIAEAVDRVQERMQSADAAEDQLTLALALKQLLTEAGRYDGALRLIDQVIEQAPDNVRFPISKATFYCYRLNDPEKALPAIDLALERAFRTRFFRREALNQKARILLKLGRGKEIGEVLEQIMTLKMFRNIPDDARQRDFVDDAPPGLIPEDIVARYDAFCPKPADEAVSSSEPLEWSPPYEEIWLASHPNTDIVASADRDRIRARADTWMHIYDWIHQLQEKFPVEEVIERIKLRLRNADAGEHRPLQAELEGLFIRAKRYDEALQFIDSVIEQKPDDVRYPISKATLHCRHLVDLPKALECIDVALERAFRTKFFLREALGIKARILLDLGRGKELGQVLEQIMSLDMIRGIPDIGKERDFVDRAPPELIAEDVVARYDRFCPKDDRLLELHRWADQLRQNFLIEDVIGRVRARMQDAGAGDAPALAHILGLFLTDAGRLAEALPLFDAVIEEQPDNVRSAIAKATLYRAHLDDPQKALDVIDLALERAFRTRFYRRQALGEKARILLKLGRGAGLTRVLEQIMSLQMFSDVRDVGRERDFVDRAPPVLIAEDIVARYNVFCPKVDHADD